MALRRATVRSEEWPAWFSFWFPGCWRALAKGTAWLGGFYLRNSSSSNGAGRWVETMLERSVPTKPKTAKQSWLERHFGYREFVLRFFACSCRSAACSKLVVFFVNNPHTFLLGAAEARSSAGRKLVLAIWGVYKRFSGEAKIINCSRDRFFLFGLGRARREQPNAGLHLGARAFVRSVSHVKVLVASLFGLF